MSSWEGINDASSDPPRVWLTQAQHDTLWIPLRKCDCLALNNSSEDGKVIIDGGRATADLANSTVGYNFLDMPSRRLTSAVWFQKEKKGEKKAQLKPITSLLDEAVMERVFKNALKVSSSSDDEKLKSVLSEVVPLKDEDTHNIYVVKIAGSLSLRKCSRRIFSLEGYTELQRGYGDYTVDGEKEDDSLGPVGHLVFVIHGVGEAVWSRENVNIQGIAEGVEKARISVNKKLYDGWRQDCDKSTREGKELPSPPKRIEFIPIQWSDQIHSASSTLKNTLISTTLQSIPKLRVVANDVVFDVLMYLTPEFCEKVLTTVTQRICDFYGQFLSVHDSFLEEGGTCSLVGHSLGSVIAWDILSILQDNVDLETLEGNSSINDSSLLRLPIFDGSAPYGYQAFASDTVGEKTGTWGPSLTKKMLTTIPFTPKFTFFLGSPLGMFLTLRGARPLFNSMQSESAATTEGILEAPTSPFSLPGSVYNIFHSSDPVAYRIEPLLLPPETAQADIPPPLFLVPNKRGMRFHVKAKEIGDNLLNTFSGFLQGSIDNLPDTSASNLMSKLGGEEILGISPKMNRNYNFALGGDSARVDFQLQPGVVENEYLSAISAHNSYFTNDDLLEFLIQCAKES